MKRICSLCVLALILLALVVVPVMAGGDNNQRRWLGETFGLVGQVTLVDASSGTLTVLVQTGSSLVQPYIGGTLVVTTDAETIYMLYEPPKLTKIDLADVPVGASVSINGIVLSGDVPVFLAKGVTVDGPLHVLD